MRQKLCFCATAAIRKSTYNEISLVSCFSSEVESEGNCAEVASTDCRETGVNDKNISVVWSQDIHFHKLIIHENVTDPHHNPPFGNSETVFFFFCVWSAVW